MHQLWLLVAKNVFLVRRAKMSQMWPYLVKDVYQDQVTKSMQAAQLVTG